MRTYDSGKNTSEVRQGNRRMMTSRILIISTVLVVLAFAVIFFIFASQPNPTAL